MPLNLAGIFLNCEIFFQKTLIESFKVDDEIITICQKLEFIF